MTVTDQLLHEIVDAGEMFWGDPEVQEMAAELLAYREAERKRNSWDNAPRWAKWRAMNNDGERWYYKNCPVWLEGVGEWISSGDRCAPEPNTVFSPELSLEKRPEDTEEPADHA